MKWAIMSIDMLVAAFGVLKAFMEIEASQLGTFVSLFTVEGVKLLFLFRT